MSFRKAEKRKSFLRLALTSPSGGGKTYSALRIAVGIAKKIGSRIALIDTEQNSASLYADKFDFDVNQIRSPYNIDSYLQAIKDAEDEGYKVLIIDSATHGWNWLLERIDKLTDAKYKGNSFRAWGEGTPLYKKWIDTMLSFPGHIIVTMRAKTEYAVETRDGKAVPVKMGLGPENRKGIEYEFTTVMEGNVDHTFFVTKDRTGLFQDEIIDKPDEKIGTKFINWLNSGMEPEQEIEEKPNKQISRNPDPKNKLSPEESFPEKKQNKNLDEIIFRELDKKDMLRFYDKDRIREMSESQKQSSLNYIIHKLQITGLEFEHIQKNMEDIKSLGGNPILEQRYSVLLNYLENFVCMKNKYTVFAIETTEYLKKLKTGKAPVGAKKENDNDLHFEEADNE